MDSKTRKETCPIFYCEYVVTANAAKPHRWVLQSQTALVAVQRLTAMEGLFAEHGPYIGGLRCFLDPYLRAPDRLRGLSELVEFTCSDRNYPLYALAVRSSE